MSRARPGERRRRWPAVRPPRACAAGADARDARPRAVSGRALAGRLDRGVLAAASLLAGIGLVMSYSTTAPMKLGEAVPPFFARHLVALAAALACAGAALRVPSAIWRRLALPAWAASALLLAATLTAGVEVKGAVRWLALPGLGLRFQPSELARWATVLAVAACLARRGREGAPSLARIGAALALGLAPTLLVLAQPDLGTSAVLIGLVGALLFVAGAPLRRLALPAGLALAGAIAFVSLHPYALRRLVGFLDPWKRSQDEGFQLVQSFVAFGRGGAFGVGLGGGRQKLGFLPEAHTDFILAAVAEELGLLGVLAVLAGFATLALAGTRIAARARDPFSQLLAFGAMAFLTLPAAVNAAVVMGVVPTTGFTLPLLSYGRTSLVVCGLALGTLLRIGACEAAPQPTRVAGAARRGSWPA
jgi:cell division protein FtsW